MELLVFIFVVLLFIKLARQNNKVDDLQLRLDKRGVEYCKMHTKYDELAKLVNHKESSLIQEEERLKDKSNNLDMQSKELQFLRNSTISTLPIIANIIADIDYNRHLYVEDWLRLKKNPAVKAADELKKIAIAKKELLKELTVLRYKNKYYEHMYPFIADLDDDPLSGATVENRYNPEWEKEDDAGYWLTQEEYTNLPNTKKYQLALDRYKRRRKSNAEIGRDYERFVGYNFEMAGYKVVYNGIDKGLEDFGLDLICYPKHIKDKILLVQCKCWSQNKVIHEKHINQLFGTSVQHYLENYYLPNSSNKSWREIVRPVFVTSTTLSNTAKKFANYLDVDVMENYRLKEYPIIKCNVNPTTKEQIYHLPFDQQYDRTLIRDSGESYVATVAEAERLGFRRAMRWRSS